MKNTIFFLLLLACITLQAQTKSYNNETISWNHSWIVKSTPEQNLPNVLLIGDSHVERYYPVVTNLLKDKAVVSKITTSLSMGDPTFIPQLTGLLAGHKFDYIFFNNGLHGVLFTPSEYAADISKVYKLLTKNNPVVKIVWANTTARRMPNKLDTFDAYHADVIERNMYVGEFCNKKGITVLDFFGLTVNDKSLFTGDGIHVNELGVAAQAKLIAEVVR
ncbi:MAG: SGNH/GDSL hydrolase family protein [Sediminibacterium sp.]